MATSPRVLACIAGPRAYYPAPIFAPDEVLCGTGCEPEGPPDDPQAIQIAGTSGYDIRQVLRMLPASHQPDVCLVQVAADFSSFPTHLEAVKCPKVLLVGDTHHMSQPLDRIITYARSTNFDLILTYCNRQHMHLFRSAGFQRLAWLPLILINPHLQRETEAFAPIVSFVGQTGQYHPRRRQLLNRLRSTGIPIFVHELRQDVGAQLYSRSLLSLNHALNGDTSLRILEVLSSRGCLITDQLSPESGLDQMLTPGEDAIVYQSFDDLVDKIRHYLDNPAETIPIRQSGYARYNRQHSPAVKREELFDLIFSDQRRPAYDLDAEPRFRHAVPTPISRVQRRLDAYSNLQSMLVTNDSITAFALAPPPELQNDWKDLTRLDWRPLHLLAEDHSDNSVLVFAFPEASVTDLKQALELFTGKWILLSADIEKIDLASLAAVNETMAAFGFFPSSSQASLFTRAGWWGALAAFDSLHLHRSTERCLRGLLASRDATVTQLLSACILARQLNFLPLSEALARRAVSCDRADSTARQLLADLLDAGAKPLEASFQRQQAERLCAAEAEGFVGVSSPGSSSGRRLRILVVNNLYPPQELGGYGRYIREFALALAARGHDVQVLTSDTSYLGLAPASEPGVDRSLRLMGGWKQGRVFNLEEGPATAALRHNFDYTGELLNRFRPDICLLGNLDFIGNPVLGLILQAGCPVLHHAGNRSTGYTPADLVNCPNLSIAAASKWLRDQLVQDGYDPARVSVLYPGARCQLFSMEEPPDFGTLRLLYASLVLPYKGANVFVEALAHIHLQGIPFRATVAGDSTDPQFVDNLKSFAQHHGFDKQLEFTGFLSTADLRRAHAQHNVLAFPSVFEEPLGISQLEAMAAGLLVVSSGTGGAGEVIQHEKTGLLFPNSNSKALAEHFAMIYDVPEYASRVAAEGRRFALAEFDVTVCAERLEAEFYRILERTAVKQV